MGISKKRTINIVGFSIILIILLCGFDYCSYQGPLRGYIHKLACLDGGRFGYDEVVMALETVSHSDEASKLVLGDSVAAQIFEGIMDNNPDYLIKPVNRAITFAGQYILVKDYLRSNPDTTDIYIVIYSGSLAADIETELSYQYVAMPFIDKGYEEDLEGLVMDRLKRTYGSFFLRPDIIDYINNSGVNRTIYLNAVSDINKYRFADTGKAEVSDISIEYLGRIYEECEAQNVKVHLMSTPLCDISERREECERIKEVFIETGLDKMYPRYCDGMFFEDSALFIDEVHFDQENKSREIINPMLMRMIEYDDPDMGMADIFGE